MRVLVKNILIGCLICSITLFVSSRHFVNAEVTPKWLYMGMAIGIMGMLWSIFNRKITLPARPMDTTLISATIIVFALALSLQGIIQYFGVLPSANSNFVVTGSFDNPAGFAAALVCALPLCFLFFTDKMPYIRYAAIMSTTLMAIAITLSGSRAGMVAAAIAIVVWFLSKIKNQKSKIVLVVATIALPMVLYFFKKDSADGRLLIWRTTLDMVADKPILGHGNGAFQAKYMLYQATYFTAHPDSQYAPLANNTLHPFNEYLLILSEYGIVGLLIVSLMGFFLVRAYLRNRSNEKLAALMSLLALAIFSFFSYPFRYPFTWVMLFVILMGFQNPVGFVQRLRPTMFWKHSRSIVRIVVFLLSAGLLAYTTMLTQAQIKWNRIAHLSLAGQTVEVLPEYDKLYRWLGKDGFFLYNHATELYIAGKYEESLAVFVTCTQYHNDMDVQLLLAYNYKELKKYVEAEQHLKMAAAMCPVRFIPLYELAKLYNTADRRDEAIELAKKIIDKEVKIPSPVITSIKYEMQLLIEDKEPSTDDSHECDCDKYENDDTRQGETPEQGAALPP